MVQEGETCDDGNDIDEDAINTCARRYGDGILRADLAPTDPGMKPATTATPSKRTYFSLPVSAVGDGIRREDLTPKRRL